MTKSQAFHTLLTMKRFGGNFEQHLAAAAISADPMNRQRLLTAFPEVEDNYGPASRWYSEDLG